MLKKILIVLMLSCLVPTMAFAWTLDTWARSGGGSMTVDHGTPQTVVNSSVFKTYTTTSRLVPIAITASTGYTINSLYYNSTTTNSINSLPSACTGNNQSLLCTVHGPSDQNVWATFYPALLSVTASTGSGGTVNLTNLGTIYYGSQLTSAKNFTFTPQTNFNVQSITINGVPAATFGSGVTVSPSLPAGANKQAVLTLPAGYIFTTNLVIVGTFSGPPIAIITPPQTVIPGTLTTLDGSQSTGAGTLTFSWNQTGGPGYPGVKLIANNTPGATISFTPTAIGTYTFSLTVTGSLGSSTTTTTVTVTGDLAAALRSQCYNCHLANSIDLPQNVFGNWSSSQHKAQGVVCYTCHVGANTGDHPGNLIKGTVDESTFNYTQTFYGTGNFCVTCHVPSIVTDFNASSHKTTAGFTCGSCHNDSVNSFGVHNPAAACINCHKNNGPYAGAPYYLAWPPAGFSFHNGYTENMCVNCHSLHNPGNITGVPAPHFGTYSSAQYVTANIACNNCHMQSASPGNVISAFKVYSANYDWATTGKANPTSNTYIGPGPYTEANLEAYDFKTLGTPLPATPANSVATGCVRCHTTTGFINYVNPSNPSTPVLTDIHAWGTTADRTREMINCSACHNSNSANGFDATFSRRTVGVLSPDPYDVNCVETWYNYSSAATKKIIRAKYFTDNVNDLVDSNMCIACHSGKASGNLLKQTTGAGLSETCTSTSPSIVCKLGTGTGNAQVTSGLGNSFWSNVSFIDPHDMGSADLLIPDNNRSGYEFIPGSASTTFHSNIGTPGSSAPLNGTEGPCVGCHMTAPRKHVFTPISSSMTGTISGITSPVCNTCHGSSAATISPAILDGKKQGYLAAITIITSQLAAKGVYYNATLPPYFFTTNNPSLQGSSTQVLNWNTLDAQKYGANLMGAAFNLRLLQTDAGWVHNSTTARRLLYDTIDYLDDGTQNNSVATTITELYTAGTISSTTESNALTYIGTRP